MTVRELKKKKQLFLGLLAVIIGLAVLLLLGILFHRPVQMEPETAGTTETTQQTEPSAEPTLPPPEANIYGPTDFQYDGAYLKCIAGESWLGVDVSAHQQQIDWQQVAEAGIEFAMIRLGYRGYGSGNIGADEWASANLEGAVQAGLDVGVYFFSQAVSVEEAREEAQFVLDQLQGHVLQMPVVFDWEYVAEDARTGAMDAQTLTDCTVAFCEEIRQAGYTPMLYFNQHMADTLFELEKLTDYGFWLAMYSDRMTYPYRVEMWQYTCTGTVPGIEGDVDINLYLP